MSGYFKCAKCLQLFAPTFPTDSTCPACSSFAAPSGSALAELARKTSEAFRLMEQEQAADYQDYVRRCGGSPISKIPAPGPQEPNAEVRHGGPDGSK